jgi:aryl-alcohol dehydrogenase-like predicted oxidoreductase
MTETKLAMRRLGTAGPEVSAITLGCMGMSGMYGQADERESVATIHAAIHSGINLLDTGDFYGMGHNEMLIGRALREMGSGARDQVLLSVKFGAQRGPDGAWLGYDARPAAVKTALAYTLTRLGVDHIDIYRPARLDPAVPIEETVGAIGELIEKGYVRYVGLSEMGAETVRRAAAVHAISDLQIEYSLISRAPEKEIFPALRELGVGVTAYGVLSRGLLSGSKPGQQGDFRGRLPRFTGANYEKNQKLLAAFEEFARAAGASPAQIAVAYVLAKEPLAVPVMGARTRQQLDEALRGAALRLSAEDVREIERRVPWEQVAGSRYDEHQMRMLDSER